MKPAYDTAYNDRRREAPVSAQPQPGNTKPSPAGPHNDAAHARRDLASQVRSMHQPGIQLCSE